MPSRGSFTELAQDHLYLYCLLYPSRCAPPDPPLEKQKPGIPPDPPEPLGEALQQMMTGSAISLLLGSAGYLGPDQEGGPDPNGPLGPYIRDALVGLSVIQLATRLSDSGQAQELQAVAARMVRAQAERIADAGKTG